jgi:hypothetical protein
MLQIYLPEIPWEMVRFHSREGGTDCTGQREVVKRNKSTSHGHALGVLSLFGRRPSLIFVLLMGFIREKGVALLLPAANGAAFYYFQRSASIEAASDIQVSVRTNCLLVLVLATYFACDTACSTALGLFAKRLIAPFWQRDRERRPASSTNSPSRIRSLRQWLSSPCRIEKNSRPYRSIHISHNPPPHIPSLSTNCYI